MAAVCSHAVNAAGVMNLRPLPSVANRQFNPMYMVAPPRFNYYNPYGVLMPTVQGEVDPEVSEDDSELTGRQSSVTLTITPVDTGK